MQRLCATVSRRRDGLMCVAYVLEGALEALRVPLARPADAGDRLWEHTCFELFIARPGGDAYHELNFAPYGAWAAYAFERYRMRAADVVPGAVSDVRVDGTAARFELEAEIDLARLSADHSAAQLELGVSAVIEDARGRLAYWALAHPGPKPDFHHRGAFTLRA